MPTNAVCKLNKSLYGLKHASKQWYAKFYNALLEDGFSQSATDHSLFIKSTCSFFMALLVCIDDIIIETSDEKAVQILKPGWMINSS